MEKGFEILQNIEDRATLQKHVKRARDPISMATIDKKPDEANKNQTDFSDIDQMADTRVWRNVEKNLEW